jgi:hypothetical protein
VDPLGHIAGADVVAAKPSNSQTKQESRIKTQDTSSNKPTLVLRLPIQACFVHQSTKSQPITDYRLRGGQCHTRVATNQPSANQPLNRPTMGCPHGSDVPTLIAYVQASRNN